MALNFKCYILHFAPSFLLLFLFPLRTAGSPLSPSMGVLLPVCDQQNGLYAEILPCQGRGFLRRIRGDDWMPLSRHTARRHTIQPANVCRPDAWCLLPSIPCPFTVFAIIGRLRYANT